MNPVVASRIYPAGATAVEYQKFGAAPLGLARAPRDFARWSVVQRVNYMRSQHPQVAGESNAAYQARIGQYVSQAVQDSLHQLGQQLPGRQGYANESDTGTGGKWIDPIDIHVPKGMPGWFGQGDAAQGGTPGFNPGNNPFAMGGTPGMTPGTNPFAMGGTPGMAPGTNPFAAYGAIVPAGQASTPSTYSPWMAGFVGLAIGGAIGYFAAKR